jgi:outer membrane protein assembly factor BamD
MRRSLAVFLLLSLTACQLFSPLPTGMPDEADRNVPAETIYAEAREQLEDAKYLKAAKTLESLISRYPYGRYAQQAQMEIAYAYYKQNEPAPALAAADRFIKQYPNSPNTDYVYYLKGLINFNSDLGVFGSLFQQDLSERDPKSAHDSFEAFKELLVRYPNSRYAPDAKTRMQYLINALARSEIHAASYYHRRGAHIAALNRAKNVLKLYPQAPQTADALRIMVKSYDALGMNELRDDAQRTLNANGGDSAPTMLDPSATAHPWWQFWKR